MKTYTVLPFLVSLMLALAVMSLNVWKVTARGCGIEHGRMRKRLSDLVETIARFWRPSWLYGLAFAAALVMIVHASGADASTGVLLASTTVVPAAADGTKTAQVLESFGRTMEEFKKLNDERFAQSEKQHGEFSSETKERLERVIKQLDAMSKVSEETQAKVNRMGIGGGDGKAAETAEEQAHRKGFTLYLRKGRTEGLEELQRKSWEQKDMSVGSDPDGGYWVTPDTSGRIVGKIYELSQIRQYAAQQTISTDSLEGDVDNGEVDGGWVGEAETRSASTTPQIGEWKIPVHELHSSPRATQKLLDDAAVDPEAWLANKIGNKFSRLENTAFTTGNGVKKPRGFASYTTAATGDASRAWGVMEHVATGSNGSFGTDPNGANKLIALFHTMKDDYLPGAAWYMNRTTLGQMRTILESSSAGRYLFIPSFTAGLPDMLLGLPIRKIHEMATYSTTDALAIALANLGVGYQIVDRIGIRTLRDPFTAKPYVVFYTTKRVGGDAVNFEAIKFLKFGS